MKVAYLLPDPGIPVGGTKGASVHVNAICRALASSGADVTLYAARVTGCPPPGVRLVHIDPGPVRSGREGEVARIAAARRFYEQATASMKRDRPDVVHERLTLFGAGGADLAAEVGAGRLVEVNAPIAEERARHFGLFHSETAHEAERKALHRAHVSAVSSPLARWAGERGAARAAVVPNGADTSALSPGRWNREVEAIRLRMGLEGRIVVGFVGSLKPWHGVEVLLEALSIAPRGDVSVMIVGDGPRRSALESMASEIPAMRTVFSGAVPQEQVPAFVAATDISVAPYTPSDEFYFSPLKVAEAMAAGKAVVASDFEPVAELMAATGIRVPPGDAGRLAEAVDLLADDPELRDRLGGEARTRAVRMLDWSKVAARTIDLYHQACSAAGSVGLETAV